MLNLENQAVALAALAPARTTTAQLRDWAEMGRMHSTDFNDHFTDAMTGNRTAEIALCRTELANGASPQARALARTMRTERQAELTQLQACHIQWQHGMMPG